MPVTLPDVRQRSNHDCGVACALAVVAAFDPPDSGVETAWGAVERDLRPCKVDGVDPRTLEAYLRTAGLRVLAGEMDLTDLRLQTRRGRLVICVVKNHYVVAVDVHGDTVTYHDPARGSCCRLATSFLDWWQDRDRLGAAYKHFGLIVWRPRDGKDQ